jgi:hypothetical protein
MALREVDPVEYRKLAEAVAIRFPESDRGVQAIYWLAIDTPLLEERIDLLEHYYQAPLPRAVLPSLASVRELLFEAYTFKDLDKAALTVNMYSLMLVEARKWLRKGTRDATLIATMLLEDIEASYLPPRISHTPFYLMLAAAHGGLDGYGSLVKATAKEPSDILRDTLSHYGEKLGKTPGQIQADVRTTLLSQAKPAPPLKLASFDGRLPRQSRAGEFLASLLRRLPRRISVPAAGAPKNRTAQHGRTRSERAARGGSLCALVH